VIIVEIIINSDTYDNHSEKCPEKQLLFGRVNIALPRYDKTD
jgi:hypothetical protein